ncbi:MAG: RDD family protein [Desulfatibacillaceae bacterium]
MEWYYAKGREPRGPVDESLLPDLVAHGEIHARTLVWTRGMDDWESFDRVAPKDLRSEAAEKAPQAPKPVPEIRPEEAVEPGVASQYPLEQPDTGRAGMLQAEIAGHACTQCGMEFGSGDMVRRGESWMCPECGVKVEIASRVSGPPPEVAGLGRRFLARLLDVVIVAGLLALAAGFATDWRAPSMIMEQPWPLAGWALGALVAAILVYDAVLVSGTGATPGKLALGIRVVGPDGRPGFRRAFGRALAEIPSTLPLFAGWFAALANAERRAWHDRMAGTRVVKPLRGRPLD